MVRILPGDSWKLNPSYVASLKQLGPREARRFSAGIILDALGLELDGVNILQSLAESAIFETVDALAKVVLRLSREPLSAGQVALDEGRAELVLGRRGAAVSLCLVSLGRPARIVAGEFEVELAALARATASCGHSLLADLKSLNPVLEDSPFAQRLARRVELLRRVAQLAGGPAEPAGEPPPTPRSPAHAADGLRVEYALDEGRVAAYRRGGELYSLLGPGRFALRQGERAIWTVEGPPFLALTELARASADLMSAVEDRRPRLVLGAGLARRDLEVLLRPGLLQVGETEIACPPLRLARLFLEATLDFAEAVVACNAAQAENPYLTHLRDETRERLVHLGELEAGDLYSSKQGPAPVPARRAVEPPLGTGVLKRLRYRLVWRGPALEGKPVSLQLGRGALLVVGRDEVSWLHLRTGASRARVAGRGVPSEAGALVLARGRLEGYDGVGRPLFLRDAPRRDAVLERSVAPLLAGPGQPATLCVFDGRMVAAIYSATGRTAWQFQPPQALAVQAAVGGDRVYVSADNGFLYALEAASGEVGFRVRTGQSAAGLAVGPTVVAAVGHRDGALWATGVDPLSGRPLLARPVHLESCGAPLLWKRRLLLAGVSGDESVVVAFDLAGRERFRVEVGHKAGVPALQAHGNRLYAALRDGSVACLGADGALGWRAPAGDEELQVALPVALRRGVLLAAGVPIRALDPARGEVLGALPPVPGLAALAVSAGLDLFAIDEDGLASCFKLSTHLSVVE